MRIEAWLGALLVACVASWSCASAPPAAAPPSVPAEHDEGGVDRDVGKSAPAEEPVEGGVVAAPTHAPASTASFEEATSRPESIALGDDHLQLTDGQLN